MAESRREMMKLALAACMACSLMTGQAMAALAVSEDPIPLIDVVVEKVPPGHGFATVNTGPRGEIAFRNLEPGYYEVRNMENTLRAGIHHRGGPARWQLRQRADSRQPAWILVAAETAPETRR